MKKDKSIKAQAMLETAIILVSLATLALVSMRLFSSLNLNMISRLDKYRQSRLAAVNSSTIVEPTEFLDYAPYHDISIPGGGAGNWHFDDIFYEDPRVAEAEQLLERNDEIIQLILPYKANQAYQLVGGDKGSDASYILFNVTRKDVQDAIDLCNEMRALADEAYDDYLQAISLLQQVLDQPIEPGPFDYTPEHQGNRQQLQNTIDSLNSSGVKDAMDSLLNDLLKPRLNSVINNLNHALDNWNNCREFFGPLCNGWWRAYYIQQANNDLSQILSMMNSAITPLGAAAEEQIATEVYDIENLLSSPLLKDNVVSAVESCDEIIAIIKEAGGDYSAIEGLVKDIKNDLNYALTNWDNEAVRDAYIGEAEVELKSLGDIVNG